MSDDEKKAVEMETPRKSDGQKKKKHHHKHADKPLAPAEPEPEPAPETPREANIVDVQTPKLEEAPAKDEPEKLKMLGEFKVKDPKDRATLMREHINILPFGFVILAMSILMSLFYFYPAWDPMNRLQDYKIGIVVADQGIDMTQMGGSQMNIGMMLAQSIITNPTVGPMFNWIIYDRRTNMTEEFYQSMVDDVENDDMWGFLYFAPDFTAKFLLPYVGVMNVTSYNNTVKWVTDETKQYTSGAVIDRVMVSLFASLSANIRKMMLTGQIPQRPYANPPLDLLVDPVVQERITLHTLPAFGEYLGQYVPFTVIWVCSIFTVALSFVNYRPDVTDKYEKGMPQVILQRFLFVFILSIISSLMTTALLFGAGFEAEHGFGTVFCVMWLMCLTFAGMIALVFSYLSNSGIPICVLLLILQLMTSSGLFHRLSLSTGWRWISDVFPFYHGIELIRAASYGLMNNSVGTHIGISFAWLICTWIIAFLGQYFCIGKKVILRLMNQDLHGTFFFSHWMI